MIDDGLAHPHDRARIFMVDDHEIVTRGIGGLLAATHDLQLVGVATTAADAMKDVLEAHPDVVLLDITLPDGSGIDVCRELRSRLPELRCLMLTSHDDEEAHLAALLAGAAGHLSKDSTAPSILDSIRQVARGGTLFRPPSNWQPSPHTSSPGLVDPVLEVTGTSLDSLTEDQRQILALVLDGLTNNQIATRLAVSETAVGKQITVIFATLGLRRRIDAAYRNANRIPEPD